MKAFSFAQLLDQIASVDQRNYTKKKKQDNKIVESQLIIDNFSKNKK